MKADLHFHPSVFAKGDKPHLSERKIPTLFNIEDMMVEKDIDILTITSCSSKDNIDPRWENHRYDKEIHPIYQPKDLSEFYVIRFSQNHRDKKSGKMESLKLILHGQEFKTSRGDINVIGALERIPVEKSEGNLFWLLDAARDRGNEVIVTIPHPGRGLQLTSNELVELYEQGKIDALESYDSLDTIRGNKRSLQISLSTQLPGISVSDGHRLTDLGRSYIDVDLSFDYHFSNPNESFIQQYISFIKGFKEKIRSGNFESIRNPSPFSSRVLYMTKMVNAKLCPSL